MPDGNWDNLPDWKKEQVKRREKKFMGRDQFTPAQRGEVLPGPNDGWKMWTPSQLLALYRHCPGRTGSPPVPVDELIELMRHEEMARLTSGSATREPVSVYDRTFRAAMDRFYPSGPGPRSRSPSSNGSDTSLEEVDGGGRRTKRRRHKRTHKSKRRKSVRRKSRRHKSRRRR